MRDDEGGRENKESIKLGNINDIKYIFARK